MGLSEFELIEQLLAPLSAEELGAFALTDDAAVLDVPTGKSLVVTKDMMVAGVHFFADDPADLIARKLLRVNLSDLASMGATPWRYALGLGLSDEVDDAWLRRFVAGLAEDQAEFGIHLVGGDTVATHGPMSLSLTAMGLVSKGAMLRRSGALPGDLVCVTGTIGDAHLGLKILKGEINQAGDALVERYHLPQPRVAMGAALAGSAHACIDVSDGLVADLGHICSTSQVGATIRIADIPLSSPASALLAEGQVSLEALVTGGDDYELLFTIVPEALDQILDAAWAANTPVSVIGEISSDVLIGLQDADGSPVDVDIPGYSHR
ncbi:MAG: thiamine-phosphate kinase [Proteobacteria bacterium]|nr:thiamine-phosphate kinase [Pseudomonadota bacterium]